MRRDERKFTLADNVRFRCIERRGDRRTNMSTFSPYARRVCHTTRRELEEAIACISTVYRATFVGTGLALGRKKIPSHIAVGFFSLKGARCIKQHSRLPSGTSSSRLPTKLINRCAMRKSHINSSRIFSRTL